MILLSITELIAGVENKYAVFLKFIHQGCKSCPSKMMITSMLVLWWWYKQKNFEELKIRRSYGTLLWMFILLHFAFFFLSTLLNEGDLEMFEEICEVTGEVKRGYRLRDIKTQNFIQVSSRHLGSKILFESLLTFLGQLFA